MDLQSGDILFSADSSLNSRVLRLFGNTSVSHAFLYLGDGEIAEAVGSGVHIVVAAYNYAGLPLTKTPAEWVAPGDLLHMRAGDIPSVVPVYPLQYIGHLRCKTSLWQRNCSLADI